MYKRRMYANDRKGVDMLICAVGARCHSRSALADGGDGNTELDEKVSRAFLKRQFTSSDVPSTQWTAPSECPPANDLGPLLYHPPLSTFPERFRCGEEESSAATLLRMHAWHFRKETMH